MSHQLELQTNSAILRYSKRAKSAFNIDWLRLYLSFSHYQFCLPNKYAQRELLAILEGGINRLFFSSGCVIIMFIITYLNYLTNICNGIIIIQQTLKFEPF